MGSIVSGKLADLTVFSRNLFEEPPETWHNVPVEMTVVNGEVVYEK
jgi:predicted amidohydrolase YtcJ